jgi:hypothetical protein
MPRPNRSLLSLGLLLTGLLGAPEANAQGTVWNVTNTAELFTMAQLAASGDTLRLAPGTYQPPLEILSKGLNVVGAGPGTTRITGGLRISGVPFGAEVRVQHLSIQDPFGQSTRLENNLGSVWLSDLEIQCGPLSPGPNTPLPLRISNCASVVLERCQVTGNPALLAMGLSNLPAGAALQLSNSSLWLYSSQLRAGTTGGLGTPANGPAGLRSDGNAQLDCSFALGGDAIRIQSGSLSLAQQDSQLLPGQASFCPSGTGLGQAIGGPGSLTNLPWPGPYPELQLLTPANALLEGGSLTLSLAAPAGHPAFLAIGSSANPAPALPLPQHITPLLQFLPFGIGQPSSPLTLTTPLWVFAPSVQVVRLSVQALTIDPALLTIHLSNPIPLTLFDNL